MKKIALFVVPLLLAVIIFFGATFFLDTSSGKGALQVTSIPKSSVYLDNKKIGNTPLCKCESKDLIKTGEYTIKLISEEGDFKPFEEKITINKSTLTVVYREFLEGLQENASVITLSPISDKNTSELLVISVPKDANVFLDNNAVGTTPLILKEVTESDHNLSVTKDGYKDRTIGIRTVAGYKLTSLVLLGVNPITSSPSAEPSPIVKKITILDTPTGFLRVRTSSSTASLEITRVSPGETFELINEGDGWFEIKLASPAGKATSGWISSEYAKRE